MRHIFLALFSLISVSFGVETQDFNRDVRPVLSNYCWHCHGPDKKTREGKLRLDQHADLLKDRGGYAVMVPGNPEKSEMIKRMLHKDPDEVMPPPDSKLRPSAEEIEKVRKWIAAGGEWKSHWAFASVKQPKAPKNNKTQHPIDGFVQQKLKAKNQVPAQTANPRMLLRRASLHLTGLPPTPQEVAAFVNDKRSDAYERVIDRLQASPRYGEHMAVTWLENSRYADTDGYQNDRYRYHWAWRDWVIKAYNDNMPFDVFTTKQLAGDMLPDATVSDQIATGFSRNHRINSEAGSIAAEWHAEYVADRVETVGTVFLGLTMNCCRCHDHKYDPMTQKEFYQLGAFFNNVPEHGVGPNNGNSPPFIPVPEGWPNITEAQSKTIKPAPVKLKLNQGYAGFKRPQPGDKKTVMVMHELPAQRPTYILNRGLYNQPKKDEPLHPVVPTTISDLGTDFEPNRIGLAKWLTHPKHPLTARVTVNRMWQHFFGTGLVKTSENFGIQGDVPSHPKLLDWLAAEFIKTSWNVKALQKTIMMSATYQQDSGAPPDKWSVDPDNYLLARGPRYRMSPFMLRDQALQAGGLLNEQLYGEPVKPYMPPKIWRAISNNTYKQDKGAKLYRRSLYTYWRRTIPPPTMMAFNAANREICSVREESTNTPLQALTLMNNKTFLEASRFVAERMLRDGGKTIEAQIGFLTETVLCRPPTSAESVQLSNDYRAYLKDFRASPEATASLLKVGEKPHDKFLDAPSLAALTMIASTVLNLDETITLE